jgi:predicted TIM-barrel fold metal-dependent hydrolase
MRLTPAAQRLFAAFGEFEIIDAHEHLDREPYRTDRKVDALLLFGHYTRTDLATAGMSDTEYRSMMDASGDLDERWRMFKPYLECIRYGSYARPAFIAAQEIYGFDDINDKTYRPLSEAMQKENRPGIYDRILRQRCKIRLALTQCGRLDLGTDILAPVTWIWDYANVTKWREVEKRAADLGLQADALRDPEDYVELMRAGIRKWKAGGAVGLKMMTAPLGQPERIAVARAWKALRGGRIEGEDVTHLRDYLTHACLRIAGEEELTVAVHTGMWGDFRTLDPKFMIPVVQQHPGTRFDIYHMGMPWVRETGVIAKNFANVWANLCWTHVISPVMTRAALDEWIDLVPLNKIIGFGGDYNVAVEKVYGHLKMAKEDIALVLGRRIDDGLMTYAQAVGVARQWFFDNPKTCYRLNF